MGSVLVFTRTEYLTFAFLGNSSLVHGITLSIIEEANSYQEQIPSFVI